jgi:hypothetical protein
MKIFHYDPLSLLFAAEGAADADPMQKGQWLIPAHATSVEPPKTGAGQVATFDIKEGVWLLIDAPVPQVSVGPPVPRAVSVEEAMQTALAEIDTHFMALYRLTVANSALTADYAAAYESAKEFLLYPSRPSPARVKAVAEQYEVSDEEAAGLVVRNWKDANDLSDQRGAARIRAKTAIRGAASVYGVGQALTAGKLAMETLLFPV